MSAMHKCNRLTVTLAAMTLFGFAAAPANAQDRTYRGERGGDAGYGNQNGYGGRRDRGVTTRTPNRNLEARLQTDRSQYNGNRAVEIGLSLTNVGQYDTNLSIPLRSMLYEVTIRDGRSNRVIHTLDSRRSNGNPRGLRLAVDETRSWRELWDGRDSRGERVPSGVYVVEARVAGQNAISTQIYLGGGGGRPGRPGDDDGWDDGDGGNGGNNGGGGNPERPNWPNRPGQGGGGGNNGGDSARSLQTTLTASRTVVRAGDQVRLTYTVQNGGSRNVSLRFTSGRQFDVRATNPDGKAVWQDSDGKFYTQALRDLTLRPGAEQTFTTTWTVPQNAPTGRYQLQAFLTPQASGGGSGRVGTADLTLRVVRGSAGYDNEDGYRDERYGRRDGRDDGGGNRGGYDPTSDGGYTNRRNRVPSGVISGGGLGGPSVYYGSRSGALLVSPRILTGTSGSQYIGRKVTVSGRCVALQTQIAQGLTGWSLGGDGAILPVTGAAPNSGVGSNVTVTGVLRQRPDGVVYLSVP